MISNILSLPFRKTTSQELSTSIRQYIYSKYDQHPDMFKEDFTVIDALRQDAIQVMEPQLNGAKKIVAYAGQLVWIGRRFPIDLGVDFVWYPAFGYNKEKAITLNNLKFELANILYNLSALYSQLAVSSNRSTTDGLKSACNYFCLAAGVIYHVKESVIPEMKIRPPEDLNEKTLQCLQQLLLAQAQECFWQKAVMDGYRDSSIAKLAAKTSDLYGIAGELGNKSEAINSEWIHFSIAKHYHFAAAAQYRQACDCLEKKKYGEEVARLKESIACVQEGLREAKYLNKLVLEDLNCLKYKVSQDLKRAEKDNDIIYLCPVPPKPELRNIERAEMAFSKVPLEISEPLSFIGDRGEFGPPLFEKLVPFAVHIATSIFEQRLDRTINNSIINPMETLTTKIHSTLSSLSLPGSLQALEKPLGLPPTLHSHAEEVRQSDAIARLKRSFSDTSTLAETATSIYTEARSHLITECTENERLKAKYGTNRWTRLDSALAAPKLYAQLDEIDGYLKSAANSDRLIHDKFLVCEDMLRILSSSVRELSNFVPSTRRVTLSPKLTEQVTKLRNSLNELNRLEARRRKKIENIRERASKDDIKNLILVEAARLERTYPDQSLEPAHFEEFLEKKLSEYDSDIVSLKSEEEEQNKLLRQLEICHSGFIQSKNGDDSGIKEREKVLQGLEDAYFQYKEIISNLESGRKFYNDLGRIVGRFRDEVKTWAIQRREEAVRLESEYELPSLSSMSLTQSSQSQQKKQNSPSLPSQKSHDHHYQQHQHSASQVLPRSQKDNKSGESGESGESVSSIRTSISQNSLSQPTISIWNPGFGIKFAAPDNTS